ncbi:MAG: AbrB/MazE/SpoVT family DNA-binding domain-containing protein [Candidatus Pacebacteria bacterium]|nr:AbrB/MazE/SpoVT family DNA-binding domain-containing protein [Candidatus Paceibacterota bacterium]
MVKIQSKSIIQTSRLSRKNQIVVPAKIRRALKIQGGDELSWRLIRDKKQSKVLIEPKPKSWASHTRGLGKKVWKNLDINQYLQNLRQEWNSQK